MAGNHDLDDIANPMHTIEEEAKRAAPTTHSVFDFAPRDNRPMAVGRDCTVAPVIYAKKNTGAAVILSYRWRYQCNSTDQGICVILMH